MRTWNEFFQEARRRQGPHAPRGDFDAVRREQLRDLAQHTGRDLVSYIVDFLDPGRTKAAGAALSINPADKLGFLEVTRKLSGPAVDILIESPGGSAEATEAIVRLLRQKFTDVRFIIPNMAKSAATMMAMSGNQLVLDGPSELGPIDPQFIFYREGNPLTSPAQGILDQFDWATEEIKNHPEQLPVWVPILNQYGPSLLVECHTALDLSKRLVAEWLETYMFADQKDGRKKARRVAQYLAAYRKHLSHGRPFGMAELQQLDVNVLDMSTDPALQERVWNVYNSVIATFIGTGAYKIFENHLGDCLVQLSIQVAIPVGATAPQPPQPPAAPPPSTPPASTAPPLAGALAPGESD